MRLIRYMSGSSSMALCARTMRTLQFMTSPHGMGELWGSLRLAPIIYDCRFHDVKVVPHNLAAATP